MIRQHLSSGTKFRWQNATYRIMRLLSGGQANLEELLTGVVTVVEISILVQALFNAELFFVDGERATTIETQTTKEKQPLPLSDYSERLVSIARYRLEIIRPLIEVEERTHPLVLARFQEIKAARQTEPAHSLQNAVSVPAIYRWIRDNTSSGYDLRALIPAVHERGGKNKSRLRTEVENLADIVIQDKCNVKEKITIDDVRCELAVRIAEENQVRSSPDQLSLPSRATLARRMETSPLGQEQRIQSTRGETKQADSLPELAVRTGRD